MGTLRELREELQKLDAEIAEIIRAMDNVPASLPWSEFVRRLNLLEDFGIALEERRSRVQEKIQMYEDLLAEVRQEVRNAGVR